MNDIVVITYNHPHRKTQDVITGLKMKNYQKVMLLALPFVVRENPFQPLFSHRLQQCYPIYPKDLAQNFKYNFALTTLDDIENQIKKIQPKTILIAGAGILPESLVQHFEIVNSHPAYLPEVRGLDALKWAIYHKNIIGVTSHIINKNADAGWLIDRVEIPVYTNDTFHAVAYRQYFTEIKLLIESIEKVKSKNQLTLLPETGKVNKRMPKNIERDLLKYFEDYKKNFAR